MLNNLGLTQQSHFVGTTQTRKMLTLGGLLGRWKAKLLGGEETQGEVGCLEKGVSQALHPWLAPNSPLISPCTCPRLEIVPAVANVLARGCGCAGTPCASHLPGTKRT